ncbi:helix-turn-helix domain-containing protein [Bordetella sp. BOR01]|uniref:helix-turn-helix domain-containing protein n=1 Tax=Bordetella sp. BOR01 TaxID=2854779 RepID=UPI001C48C100|nr:helix-turn-helix domain-containing protein [Bordetella sp. BOR01]MBV7483930.1 helix-turn-helix domain-containing protein [Bordetella sp. BOR01]
MDQLITAAARALAAGDVLGALNRVALRDDAPALALRGIAMAQLGDLERARGLLRGAARAFGPREALARARCVVAEAEIALALRDLGWPAASLDAARTVLERQGDRVNAAHAHYIEARRLLLVGKLKQAECMLAQPGDAPLPAALQAVDALVAAGIAMRRMQAQAARAALARAWRAARRARIGALTAEVDRALQALDMPVARLMANGRQGLVRLDEVESLAASETLVVDACRHAVRDARTVAVLARRPILFLLVRALGEAWPGDVPRGALIARVFRTRHADESHRVRLRVEMGRLRKALGALAGIEATARGYVLAPRAHRVAVLAWPDETPHAAVLALLADGESWPSSALAVALDASQRTVQRALDALAEAGRVQPLGHGRARRWLAASLPEFTTSLLLPGPFFSE